MPADDPFHVWLAGFLDGRGYLGVIYAGKSYSLRVKVTDAQAAPLEQIQAVTRLGNVKAEGKGGRVFVCPNTADRDKLAGYYQALAKSSAAFFSHVFTKGNIVLQINGELKEDQAKKYEAALP